MERERPPVSTWNGSPYHESRKPLIPKPLRTSLLGLFLQYLLGRSFARGGTEKADAVLEEAE